MNGNGLLAVIDRDGTLVSLKGGGLSNGPGRGGIGIAVEAEGKILMNQKGLGFSAIGQGVGQRPEGNLLEAGYGLLPRCLMDADIGYGIDPISCLFLHIVKIVEGS